MAMAMLRRVRLMEMNKSTIHSGHYMMSCLDEASDDTDYYGCSSAAEPGRQRQPGFKPDSDGRASKSTSCFIEGSLAELLRYMTLTYNGTLPSPKWKDFKGIKLKLRQKIRLNNIIWREWHMQYIKLKNPVVCQFDVPTSDRTHNKPEAVVLEGKYSKRRLESLAVEYSRWRIYAKQRQQLMKHEERELLEKKMMLDNIQLDGIVSLMQSLADQSATVAVESNEKKCDFNNDSLFTSLAQPFAFPCVREIVAEARNYFNSEMMVQPGLVQLQPNLPEHYTPCELKPCTPLVGQKVIRQNPILSYLLTGNASRRASEIFANRPQSLANTCSSVTSRGNEGVQTMPTTKSTTFFVPPNELNASFDPFSSKDSSSTMDSINYFQNSSMNFVKRDLQSDTPVLNFGSSGFPPPSFPLPPSGCDSSNRSNHLRALLQCNDSYCEQQEDGASGCANVDSSVLPLPTKRRRSTGQSVQGLSTIQVCNKNLQRLISSEEQNRSYRRASTGTLGSNVGLTMASSSAVFTVPQKKIQNSKYRSLSSQPLPESPQMTVRRRKTSCVSRGTFVMNYHEDTGALVGNGGRGGQHILGSPVALGSPVFGATCFPGSATVAELDPPTTWDVPVTPKPMDVNCLFDNEVFDCEMGISDATSRQINTALVNIGGNSIPTSPAAFYVQLGSSENFHTNNEELGDHDVKPATEQDRQQPQMQNIEQRRALHLSSEQKRRVTINNGFEKLDELIRSSGDKPSSKSSKSATLHKSALLMRNLQKEKAILQNEADLLKKEIQILQDSLNILQSNLPVTGCLPTMCSKTEAMCELYDDYVRTRTQSNWKFWIFAQLMRPMYNTYVQSVSSVIVSNLCQAAQFWLEQHCSLTVLRPAFSNELREICRKTSIINDPSKLPEEARRAANSEAD